MSKMAELDWELNSVDYKEENLCDYHDFLLSKVDVQIHNNIKLRRVNGTFRTKKKILQKKIDNL